MTEAAKREKATIVVFSGDMDKVFAAFTIATGCAASEMETTMFFTFWGLKAIQKGNLTGKGLFGRMVGIMNRGGIERVGPSRFNFGGIGRWMFKKMMRDKRVSPLSDLLQAAIDLDIKMYACKTSMDVMEIQREDLIDAVAGIAGVATMLKDASESQVQFFI
ncbi:MAG TPA: DsrE/DsrF/DrsH-like family protein [Anaerolineae bacterium]|nr:DsrE/DsrF/DrsH-like family protein [Anaerolineae bacterium]HOQ97478.1 DsrE/DsrF/DrsH-like family protein [Anaerolineae bacterium]HPL29646.1 DsrE/DsrF/DrsH-like family protein [Anaerolineae bacterium]